MNTQEALKIVGGLSKPSKMPGWAYGLPAAECKTGGRLKHIPDQLARVVTLTKVVTCFQLFRLHNTEDWRLYVHRYGLAQWHY